MTEDWILCSAGCGLHHHRANPKPLHERGWLEAERERLQAELANTISLAASTIARMQEEKAVLIQKLNER